MHANNRATVIADSTHYQAAYFRMQEAYDYAQARYRDLEKYVFIDGQTPFLEILADPRGRWEKVKLSPDRIPSPSRPPFPKSPPERRKKPICSTGFPVRGRIPSWSWSAPSS